MLKSRCLTMHRSRSYLRLGFGKTDTSIQLRLYVLRLARRTLGGQVTSLRLYILVLSTPEKSRYTLKT